MFDNAPLAEEPPAPSSSSSSPPSPTSALTGLSAAIPRVTDLSAALAGSVSAMLVAPLPPSGSGGSPSPSPTANVLLAPGLDTRMLDRILAGYEWVLGIRLTDDQREQFADAVVADVIRRGPAVLAEYQQAAMLRDSVPVGDDVASAALREQVQPQAVWSLRQTPDPVAAMLVRAYDAANLPIAEGVPPLTQEMADCCLALVMTVDGYRQGVRRQANEALRADFTRYLADLYPTLPINVRSWFATLPAGWTAMALQLRDLPPQQQAELITQIDSTIQALGLIGPPAQTLPAPSAPKGLSSPTNVMPAAAPRGTFEAPIGLHAAPPPLPAAPAGMPLTPDATARPPGGPGDVGAALSDIVARDEERLAQVRSKDPALALQEKAASSALYATLLSNISASQHQTMMAWANNLGRI